MAGRDQSANLTGMLTDIGATVGSMGDAYKPVLQAATKPRGDMSDPAHLQNLAQWATQNGDVAAASMYMTQSREAKAEQKAAKNVAFVGKTGQIAASAQQRAQEGDVTNLDRNIAELKRRVQVASESGEATQLASAQSALKSAIASRDGADKVQVGNHIKAVGAIDSALADPAQASRQVEIQNEDGTVTQSTVGDELIKRRAKLMSDQRVSDGIIEREVTEYQQREAEITVRGSEFLAGHSEGIRQAIARGDEQALAEIQDQMPGDFGIKGEAMFNDYVIEQRKIEADAVKRDELAKMDIPYDFEAMGDRIESLEADYPELMEPIRQAEAKLRGLEKQRSADGTVLNPNLILTARNELEAAITSSQSRGADITLRSRVDREGKRDAEILLLERRREEGWKPNEGEIRASVSAALRYDAEYQKAVEKDDFKDQQARAAQVEQATRDGMRQSFYSGIDSSLRSLGVESEQTSSDAYTSANSGTVVTKAKVSAALSNDGPETTRKNLKEAGFSDEQIDTLITENGDPLPEVKVTATKRSTTPYDGSSAKSVYRDSFVTAGANAVGDGFSAIGDYFDERGRRAKEKLNR
jgi:hypothetical protein